MYVHLAPEKLARSIERRGIRPARVDGETLPGIYAMPVLPAFHVSHQWLRELKRSGQRTLVGVYFRIPDDEPVLFGHYGSEPVRVTAAEAAGLLMESEDPAGFEVMVERPVPPGEIHAVHHLPQLVGWRYSPQAKGRKPCGCPACVPRGEIRGRRLRERYEASFSEE